MDDLVKRLRHLHDYDEIMDEAADLIEEQAALLREASAFVLVWASKYARDRGYPDGHLHPDHFDLAERMGANMGQFTRAKLEARK